jgi:hypothetical protein
VDKVKRLPPESSWSGGEDTEKITSHCNECCAKGSEIGLNRRAGESYKMRRPQV